MSRIERIVRNAMKFQNHIVDKIPLDKRKEGEGRTGKLIVDDPTGHEHTVLYFKVGGGKLQLLDQRPEGETDEIIFLGMPERGYYGVDLFIDVMKERGLMRKAYTEDWLIIPSALASYHSEEWLQLVEDFVDTIAKKMGFR